MGNQPAKSEAAGGKLTAVNILDLLATKYILTQNFQDLKRLSSPEYCNKLVILTKDVIKKYLNEKEITFLAERVENGRPVEELMNEKVAYLDTSEIKKRSPDVQPSVLNGLPIRPMNPPEPARMSMLSELDVKDHDLKDRMCKGIAKFYIKIAHLFAAIVKTINPIYRYTDSAGVVHEYSLMNKYRIPDGVKVSLRQPNLCTRRIRALKSSESPGKITARVRNCDLNRKVERLDRDSIQRQLALDKLPGSQVEVARTLGDEAGIPQLNRLYYDVYNYSDGRYDAMSKTSKADYDKDLKTFYRIFTGKNNFNRWKKDVESEKEKKNKKPAYATFSDVPLVDYHNKEVCINDNSPWKQTYVGTDKDDLFVKYAENVRDMMQTAQQNQGSLLDVLDQVFIEKGKGSAREVTINPKLDSKALQKVVEEARSLIIRLYINCEKNYQTGLQLFEAIIGDRILKTSIMKKDNLEKQLDEVVIDSDADPNVRGVIEKSIMNTAEMAAKPMPPTGFAGPPVAVKRAPMEGAGRRRKRGKKRSRGRRVR